ncbi:MAG: hypothetical protein R3C14_23050 [Caldilineaceae bacterium]
MYKKIFATLLVITLLWTEAVLPVVAQEPDPGDGQTNYTVQNLSDTTQASLSIQFVDRNGKVVASASDTLAPKESKGSSSAGWGTSVPAGFDGSVYFSSSQEVAVFAQVRWQNNTLSPSAGRFRTAGAYNYAAFSPIDPGGITLYYPSLSARDGQQFCNITVQSTGDHSDTIKVKFDVTLYNRDGATAKTLTNQEVNRGAAKTIVLPNQGLGGNWLGSAVVTSQNTSDLFIGFATCHWTGYSTAYSALTESGGAQTIYVPEARRRVGPAGFEQFAAILVQNLSTSDPATVTVKWYDRNGNQLYSFQQSIPANSSKGFNTRFPSDVPDHAALDAALGNAYNGPVIIESSGPNIAAIVNLQFTANDGSVGEAATSYAAATGGSAQIFIPAAFRLHPSTGWKQFTSLIIQNVGPSACNNFDMEWFERAGASKMKYQDSLPAGVSHGYNTQFRAQIPTSADPASLGDDFNGSVIVTSSGCQLIAIHNTLWPDWTDATTYNGFGK